jgi:hypothetical protein
MANRTLLGLLLVAACDDTLFGPPFEEGEGATYTADWAGVEEMFGDHCASCHPALNAFALGPLESDVRDGAEKYVVPGDLEASWLWRKVSNTVGDGDGGVMPPGSQGLSVADREGLRMWIEGGALLPDGG